VNPSIYLSRAWQGYVLVRAVELVLVHRVHRVIGQGSSG
jgi:hypothetical protein